MTKFIFGSAFVIALIQLALLAGFVYLGYSVIVQPELIGEFIAKVMNGFETVRQN